MNQILASIFSLGKGTLANHIFNKAYYKRRHKFWRVHYGARSRANKKYMPTSIFSGHKDYYHRRQNEDQAVDEIHMFFL